jgi:F0F1-type ATP synthase assembly protein I
MQRLPAGVRLIGMGWYVAVCIVLGLGGGIWLDNQTRTLPLFTLLGLFLGLAAAFVGIYRMVQETVEDENRQERDGPR